MPLFTSLPIEVKSKLIEYFADKPVGTKLKCAYVLGLGKDRAYTLKNSYIKLETDTYALAKGERAIIGEGSFGKVKYARSLSSDKYVVMKTIPFVPSDARLDSFANEIVILHDLGLYRDNGIRKRKFDSKQYIAMVNAGLSLDKYIKLHPKLKVETRVDLAIKLCWLVSSLHKGILSRGVISYAHRDIKPGNVVLSSSGAMCLIDVGIADSRLNTLNYKFGGSSLYMPSLMTFLAKLTLKHLDVLALKRTIHMPNRLLCEQGLKTDEAATPFGAQMLLSKEELADYNLLDYFDTSAALDSDTPTLSPHQYAGDPLILASLLVLGRFELVEFYGSKMNSPILAYAVLGMYFAKQDKSDEVTRQNIASAIVAYVLGKIVPRYAGLAEHVRLLASLVSKGVTNNLINATTNKTLIRLIQPPSIALPTNH